MVECPFCGKECSSYHYLGQHIDKKDNDLHNGRQAEQVSQDLEQETESGNPENVVDDWKENNQQQESENGAMQVNEIPLPDEPSDSPDYISFSEIDADDLTQKQTKAFAIMKENGHSKVEKNFDEKPIEEVDFQ